MLHTTGVQRVGKVQGRIFKFLVVKWKEVTVGFFSIIFKITKNDCETANFLITVDCSEDVSDIFPLKSYDKVRNLSKWCPFRL